MILSDCNIAHDLDFADLMEKHIASGANVTMVYERAEIPLPIQTENYTLYSGRRRPHHRAAHQ